MKELKAHNFPEVYQSLGLNLNTLGCVMLDLEPISINHWLGQDSVTAYIQSFPFHKSLNPERFWIDGYVADKTPHVTLLYGLLQTAKNYKWHIDQVLAGWSLPEVEIEKFGYFPSPYPDEEYYCVVGHLKITPELQEGHERLCMLPHLKTFPGYKAHVSIAYIKKEDVARDNLIADLTREFVGKKLKVSPTLNLGGDK